MSIDEAFKHEKTTGGTEQEAREHQGTLQAKRTVAIPTDLQMLSDYAGRSDRQPVYLGFGPQGLGEGNAKWLIQKFTYDSRQRVTERKSAYGSWTNRATHSYS